MYEQEDLSLDPKWETEGRKGPVYLQILCGTNLDSSFCALVVSPALLLMLVKPQAAPLPQFTHSSDEKDAPCLIMLPEHPVFKFSCASATSLVPEDQTAGLVHLQINPGFITHRALPAE